MNVNRRRRAVFAGLGLLSLAGLWQLGFVLGGPFVLPAPADAFAEAFDFIRTGAAWQPASITTAHVLIGYAIGAAIGLCLGLIGGAVDDLGAGLGAISTVILGIPPIIWIVLALFWFGPQGIVPTFTVAIGIAPVVFAAALTGMRSAHPEFEELAAAFNAPWTQRLFEIRLPQLSIALAPALASALGFAWKIALMAEILDAGSGLGGRIATARSNLDLTATMTWVVIALALLLVCDLLLAKFVAKPSDGSTLPM
jgi:NitT/TauT family transport system permease protein